MIPDEPTSKVHGYVYNDVFQGRIKFDNVPTYVIESTFPYADKIDTKRYHSFIYRHKDMHEPESIKFAATEAKGMSRYGLFLLTITLVNRELLGRLIFINQFFRASIYRNNHYLSSISLVKINQKKKI